MVLRRNLPFGRSRRERDSAHRSVVRGAPVKLSAKLRRTSARGWGPWTDVELRLGPLPSGPVRWRAEDPIAVGLASTHGPVEETMRDLDDLYARDIRFRTEGFWGMEGEILVFTSERNTVELALPAELSAIVLDRLRVQLGFDDDL